ncbi:MAG: cob(I)yrinic acid a,c-diamide adenosyltransferase [Hyphomicrobiales bacterium]
MKIYTRAGDRGQTSLFSGERVPKGNERIEAYGDLDELNSVIGALISSLPEPLADIRGDLQQIQSDLFNVGAWLATTPGAPAAGQLQPIDLERTSALELRIDRMDEGLPALKGFILPGGHASAAWAHIARAVCRRAERRAVGLASAGPDAGPADQLGRAVVYLNRLSDYFFVLARYVNRTQGVEDSLWKR